MEKVMRAKKMIWFDLGCTLLSIKIGSPMKTLLQKFGHDISLEQIDKTFHLCDKFFMREYPGLLGEDQATFIYKYIEMFAELLEISPDIRKLTQDWLATTPAPWKTWEPFPFAVDVLSTFSRLSKKIGVITNWDSSARQILDDFDLTGYFDSIVVSSEIGLAKPQPEIFEYALDQAGVHAAESIYIGDNYYDDAIGAAAVGMDSIIINPFGKLGVEEISGVTIVPDIRFLLPGEEWQ